MACKSKICKAFFFGRMPLRFGPNHPPNFTPRFWPCRCKGRYGSMAWQWRFSIRSNPSETARTLPRYGVEASSATGGCKSFLEGPAGGQWW